MALVVKNPPASEKIQEIRVRSLGQEDSLEKEVAIHSNIPAWRIPRTEKPGGLQSILSQSRTWLSDLARTHIATTNMNGSQNKERKTLHHLTVWQMGQKVVLIISEQIENVTWTTQAWSKWKEMHETTQTVAGGERERQKRHGPTQWFYLWSHLSIRRKQNSRNRKKSSTVASLHK